MTQRERIYRALSERDNDDLHELVGSINSYSGGLTELEFLPMDDELRRNAASCEAQERPLDPADVREWADFWLTLCAQAPRQPA